MQHHLESVSPDAHGLKRFLLTNYNFTSVDVNDYDCEGWEEEQQQ